MKQLNFQTENLKVDYLTFSFSKFPADLMNKLVRFLHNLGFNVFTESDNYKQSILQSQENQWMAIFSNYGQYTRLSFSGGNAAHFYQQIMEKLICWELFEEAKLSRLDLCFERPTHATDLPEIKLFFKDCQDYLQEKDQNIALEQNNTGPILKVGNRRRHHFLRVYSAKTGLRFEYEMKGKALQDFHNLIISNQIKEFEHKATYQFLARFGKTLPLKNRFLNWLVYRLRPLRKQLFSPVNLNLEYLDANVIRLKSFQDKTNFIKFLQFLVFAHSLDYQKVDRYPTIYRRITFSVHKFLSYQNCNFEPNNFYQLKKARTFLLDLQYNSLVESFTHSHYRSLVTVPEVTLIRPQKREGDWVVSVLIADELFKYAHPFLFPDFFAGRSLPKFEFIVLFEIIRVFSANVGLEKEFHIDQFLDAHSKVNNLTKVNMCKAFIFYLQQFQQLNLIEDHLQLLNKDYGNKYDSGMIPITELTTRNIRKGFTIYEKLDLS